MNVKWKNLLVMVVVFLAVSFVMAQDSLALGIAPATESLSFEPGLERTFSIKVINRDGKEVKALITAGGELGEYVELNENYVYFSEGEKEKKISYTIRLPEGMEEPGPHRAEIMVMELPPEEGGGMTKVSAILSVTYVLTVNVPYPGKYAKARLFVSGFKLKRESNFLVEVENLGSLTIFAIAVIDILGPLGEKITTLTSDEVSIDPKEKEVIAVKWIPEIQGEYFARVDVIYNDHSTRDEKKVTIGELMVDIDSISTGEFSLGGIAKFNILVENKWNREIPDVYAEVTIKDRGGKEYTRTKTASSKLEPFGKQMLIAYWDTERVDQGDYVMSVVLHYEGTETTKEFDVKVFLDKIEVALVGMIVEGPSEEPEIPTVYIFTFVVIILSVMNIVIYMKLRGRRGGKYLRPS